MRCLIPVLLLASMGIAGDEPEKKPAPEKAKPIPKDWPPRHKDDFQKNRDWMVRTQLETRGIGDVSVLDAMRAVPRHRFVPQALRPYAYEDRPLPIGHDQTISQPYIVASMTEELALRKGMKVLEIGTGSGYQAAVLARITPWVYTIEIKKPLAVTAKANLKRLGYTTVEARRGDGYYGWPEAAPFDAILVTAAVPHVPPPLVKQLKPGGRMVLPVGPPFRVQDLRLITKGAKGRVRSRSLYKVRFVPLTGSLGRKEGEKKPPEREKPPGKSPAKPADGA
jgi:protein-L-isoaspartate(D-aspartate) O-methyltransferase